ncbi:MAG: hypothetical protein J6W63_02795, partial [Treponema sp.]|nr:hypothetical protein [Treponema sp.]
MTSSSTQETKADSTYISPSFYSTSSLFADEATSEKASLYDKTDSVEKDTQTSYASTQSSSSQLGSSQIPDDLIYSSPSDNGFGEPDETDDDKGSSKKWPLILTVVGVFLLLGLGGFLVANLTNKNKTEKNPINTRL